MMPISTVQSVTFIKIHHIRHVREIVTWTGHKGIAIHHVNVVLTRNGRMKPGAGGYNEGIDQIRPFVSISALVGQVNIYPPFLWADIGRDHGLGSGRS